MFKGIFFRKLASLTGAPPVRRLKLYSARSGYVYEYYYQGFRTFEAAGESGTEFVFGVSPDRKNWHDTSVLLGEAALTAWETTNTRQLSATERYAIAKMGLFQAFDERTVPAQMKDDVRLRAADVEAILNILDL